MLEVLVGICLVWWIIYIISKSMDNEVKRKTEWKNEIARDELKRKISEPSPEEALRSIPRSVYDREMSAVFGQYWQESKPVYSWDFYENLLLSTQGKLSWRFFCNGNYISHKEERAANDIKICQRIEYNLKQAGVEARFYLEPDFHEERDPFHVGKYITVYDFTPLHKKMVLEQWQIRGKGDPRSRLWSDESTDEWTSPDNPRILPRRDIRKTKTVTPEPSEKKLADYLDKHNNLKM